MTTSGRPAVSLSLAGFFALSAACVPDWDKYDPRLGDPSSSSTGAGGGGGAGGAGGGSSVCQAGSKVACYTGPPGTEMVGDCKGGFTTCNAEGTAVGPCEGEVVPEAETCTQDGDEDCDGEVNEDGADCACEAGTEQSCYGGPRGTANVGACAPGTQVCEPGGAGYGPCAGEVVPVLESCATPADDDCEGSVNDHCALWTKTFGSGGDQYPWDVAVDADDNIIIGGRFINTIDFAGGTLVSEGANDAFLAKLSPSGAHVWSKRFGDVAEQEIVSVAVDAAGNVYATGFFSGSIQLGAQPQTSYSAKGDTDIFAVKYDPNGDHVWSRAFGDAASQAGLGIAVDATGSVILAGRTAGTVDFGGGALTAPGVTNGYLVKLDPQGNHLWSKLAGAGGENAAQAVDVDAAGNIYAVGYFTESITFGDPPQSGAGGHDVFVSKLTPLGLGVWTRAFGDAADQEAFSVDAGATGDAVVLGELAGAVDFDGTSFSSKGADDIFVAYLDTVVGAVSWAKGYGDAADQEPGAAAFDASGDVLLTGGFQGSFTFGGLPLKATGTNTIFLVKLMGLTGDHAWSRAFGGSSDQDGRAVVTDSKGDLILIGGYSGDVDFGSGSITAADAEDVYVVKLSP